MTNKLLTNGDTDNKSVVIQEKRNLNFNRVTYYRKRQIGPESLIEDALLYVIPNILASTDHPFWIAAYLPIGAGLPDYTVAAYKKEIFKIVGVKNVSTSLLAYLHSVSNVSASTIATRLNMSIDETRSILDEFVSADVVSTNGNLFYLSKVWRTILPDVFTIEAKVNNWKNAIEQAKRNQLFSHRSFVALPNKIAKKVCFNNRVKERGIGVIGVGKAGEATILRKAKKNTPKVWMYYFAIAIHVAKRIGCENNSFSCFGRNRKRKISASYNNKCFKA